VELVHRPGQTALWSGRPSRWRRRFLAFRDRAGHRISNTSPTRCQLHRPTTMLQCQRTPGSCGVGLKQQGEALIPGSTLSLGDSKLASRAPIPAQRVHGFKIERTYGTSVANRQRSHQSGHHGGMESLFRRLR